MYIEKLNDNYMRGRGVFSVNPCHSREGGNPESVCQLSWIPLDTRYRIKSGTGSAGMTAPRPTAHLHTLIFFFQFAVWRARTKAMGTVAKAIQPISLMLSSKPSISLSLPITGGARAAAAITKV